VAAVTLFTFPVTPRGGGGANPGGLLPAPWGSPVWGVFGGGVWCCGLWCGCEARVCLAIFLGLHFVPATLFGVGVL